jgi:hypothetical protein
MMWLLAQYLTVLSFNFNSDHYTHSEFSQLPSELYHGFLARNS